MFGENGRAGIDLAKIVAIIVPTWNNRELLRKCLSSLQKTEYPSYRVVVVDNGSTDGSPEQVEREFPHVELIRLPRNEGFSSAANSGLEFALHRYNTDYAVILNNDTLITDGRWLLHMVGIAEMKPEIGMVNCRFLTPNGEPQPMGLRLLPGLYLDAFLGMPILARNREQSNSVYETDSAGGACFLLKRSLIDAIGLLDEGYSPAYFEDVDYGLRARRAGFKLVHDGEVSIIHIGSATRRKLPTRYMQRIYKKNLVRFLGRNYTSLLPFVMMMLLCGGLLRAATRGLRPGEPSFSQLALSDELRDTVSAFQALKREK